MEDTVAIPAELRERAGKGAARAARRAGLVPAVIYGDRKEPTPIGIEMRYMKRELKRAGFFTRIFEIEAGEKKQSVLARDVQMHSIKDEPLHVDFLRVSASSRVSVAVPVQFLNEEDCPGLRRGGVLNIVRHDVELDCSANAIPDFIELDLSQADIGDSLHISQVKLPEGVEPTIEGRDFTIATIVAPSSVRSEAGEGEEGEAEDEGEAAEA